MTTREHVRNDRIATRYLFGDNAKTLAREYGISSTRVRQVLVAHIEHSRREFYRMFGAWPDDLSSRAVRPRLLHLLNQYRVLTGQAPVSPAMLRQKGGNFPIHPGAPPRCEPARDAVTGSEGAPTSP